MPERPPSSAFAAVLLALLATLLLPGASPAAQRGVRAERALVETARTLSSCLSRNPRCPILQRRLQEAGAATGGRHAVGGPGAPTLRADGRRLSWTSPRSTSTFILAARTGRRTAYTVVRGRQRLLSAVPGSTVTYRVRRATVGAPWSRARRIAFPRPFDPAAGVAPNGVRMGINLNQRAPFSVDFAQRLGARSARIGWDISTPVSKMVPVLEQYATAGIRVNLLAEFAGRIPTRSEVTNLATWAAVLGPGGSFWNGRPGATALAVDRIEFGNESYGFWQYDDVPQDEDWHLSPAYIAKAEGYGRMFREAAIAMAEANPGVRLLAAANAPGRWAVWMDGLFRAAPDLADHVGGWVVHPYGPDWARTTDDALAQAQAHGAPDAIPLYVTEVGISTDDGRCVSANYGWNRCLTYEAAAARLTAQVAAMKERYSTRLVEIDLYSAGDLRRSGETSYFEAYFGALNSAGGPKGAYTTAVKRLLGST